MTQSPKDTGGQHRGSITRTGHPIMNANSLDDLKPLGFSDKIHQNADPEKLKTSSLARIIAVHKERYTIKTAESEIALAATCRRRKKRTAKTPETKVTRSAIQ